MWSFVNNWRRTIALEAGATSAALDLPDGTYLLVISDAVGTGASIWEVVRAVVAGGTATLDRGQEGTSAEEWPAGSAIYCSLTAGQIGQVYAELSALDARLRVLEMAGIPADSSRVTVGRFDYDEPGDYSLGWFELSIGEGYTGYIIPGSVNIPGVGSVDLVHVVIYVSGASVVFEVGLAGNVSVSAVESLTVEGIGSLPLSSAAVEWQGIFNRTVLTWNISSHDWAAGEQRLVTFNFT